MPLQGAWAQRAAAATPTPTATPAPVVGVPNSLLAAQLAPVAAPTVATPAVATPAAAGPRAATPQEAASDGVQETLKHIADGTKPGGMQNVRWGVRFQNREGNLPTGTTYKEYRLPRDANGDNVRRLVVGADGSKYYTWTHYGTAGSPAFVEL